MAITRAQQFRQMLEDGGMLVQPSTTGKRPGYSNPNEDRARERAAANEKAASNREARRGGQYNRSTTKQSTFDSEIEDQTTDDDRKQVTLTGGDVGSGLARNREENITKLEEFFKYRKPVELPGFLKGPAQAFSNFNASINRPFFEKVLRAGKIPGVNFANLSNPNFNLEQAYQDYMKNRLEGKTDAYGNPMPGFSYNDDGDLVGRFVDDDPDPIPFIPPVEDDTGEDDVAEYVNPLSLLTPRIAGTQFAADGGRIGFKGGADMATVSTPTRAATAKSVNISPTGGVTTSRDDSPSGGGGGGNNNNKPPPKKTLTTTQTKEDTKKNVLKTVGGFAFNRFLNAMGVPTKDIQKALAIKGILEQAGDVIFPEGDFQNIKATSPDQRTYNIEATKDLVENLPGGLVKDIVAPAGALVMSPVYDTFQGIQRGLEDPNKSVLQAIKDENILSSAVERFTGAAAPLAERFEEGGIASLDREEFLLGGIAKGLKKAVRGVKKLVKSPVGKMALGAAIFGGGFGLGGLQRGLFGITAKGQALRGFPELAAKKGLFGKLGLTGGYGSLMPTVKGGITLASILSGLTTKEDKGDEELAKYLAQNQLDLNAPLNRRILGTDFYGGQTAADGGRIGYQEGGDAEPVAKKTMPLIDMDGKEKDYRETGGFVDMGRMERADDVPARLSKNEFVFTADAVRNAGEGDIAKGAEVMYNMMKNLEAGGEVSEESQGLEGAREMFQTSQRLGEVI